MINALFSHVHTLAVKRLLSAVNKKACRNMRSQLFHVQCPVSRFSLMSSQLGAEALLSSSSRRSSSSTAARGPISKEKSQPRTQLKVSQRQKLVAAHGIRANANMPGVQEPTHINARTAQTGALCP
jgi:hypothetical protein